MRTNDNALFKVALLAIAAICLSIAVMIHVAGYSAETEQLKKKVNTLIKVESINQKSDVYLLMTLDNLVVITEELERRLHPAEETKSGQRP